ncbi:MAG TPA: hypothetical protein VMB78_01145 [Dissulfurispiraceae bacterium]|nr:hypothetical protein [Dissulfurispiraceae bacterium]
MRNEEKVLHIVIAGREHDVLSRFGAELCRTGRVRITQVDSAAAVLNCIKADCVDLVVVGQSLRDSTPIDFVTRLVQHNAMINCAMVSAMDENDFHEATEGLGVLMQLPPNPSADDASALLEKIKLLASLLCGHNCKGLQQ